MRIDQNAPIVANLGQEVLLNVTALQGTNVSKKIMYVRSLANNYRHILVSLDYIASSDDRGFKPRLQQEA